MSKAKKPHSEKRWAMQRYGYYGKDLEPCHDGEYVKFSDAEAAIEQAKRDERAKCVAELREYEKTVHHGQSFIYLASQHLAKGLNQ